MELLVFVGEQAAVWRADRQNSILVGPCPQGFSLFCWFRTKIRHNLKLFKEKDSGQLESWAEKEQPFCKIRGEFFWSKFDCCVSHAQYLAEITKALFRLDQAGETGLFLVGQGDFCPDYGSQVFFFAGFEKIRESIKIVAVCEGKARVAKLFRSCAKRFWAASPMQERKM